MANEITVTGTLSYKNPATGIQLNASLAQPSTLFSIAGFNDLLTAFSVPTSATAIPLGNLQSLGWCIIINNDPTNYVELLTGVSGTKFSKLVPNGGFALFMWDPTVTAPAAQANTAAVKIAYLFLEI